MTEQLRHLRAIITQPEADFGFLLGKVLSPSQPLQSEEFLRGREEQLAGIKRALYQPGRHVLIHGFRGVGKSSLAQTAAYSLSKGSDPIVIACDRTSTFKSITKSIFEEAIERNPAVQKRITEHSIGFSRWGFSAGSKQSTHEGPVAEPENINDAVRMAEIICEGENRPVFVVDEFDQLKDKQEQENFTNFIKQLSDRHVGARFIFCGIGESVDAMMAAHGSADRYFHTVGLAQLPWEARFEIVTTAADRLGIIIDDNTIYRIARISDGFPHYVHFLSEKLFWRVFEAKNDGIVTGNLFELAMADAAAAMEMKLKGPYETATQKYSNDYEAVLWAVADGHELRRRSTDIYESYIRIMRDKEMAALDRDRFNQRINSLKQPSHASILSATRQGWYEFSEKVVRGYVRLKAEQSGVILEFDHPALQPRKKPLLTKD